MALPREPRQKMINMMYLVLTALLALNVSSEILNAFKTVNNSLEATNKVVNASTEEIMTSLKAKMNEDALLQQRQQNLWNENIGSKYELEQRQLAYKSSVTAYQAAVLRYTQLQKQISFQAKQSQNNLQIASSIKKGLVPKCSNLRMSLSSFSPAPNIGQIFLIFSLRTYNKPVPIGAPSHLCRLVPK